MRCFRLLRLCVPVIAALWLAASPAVSATPITQPISMDTARSEIGFHLRTRWGQQIDGRFAHWRGNIAVLPDGRHQVELVLDAASVEISGHRHFTRLTRGPGVFDVDRFPEVRFVSDPYPAGLALDGGEMTGILQLRGVQRRETFHISPSACTRPAVDCDVEGEGTVRRSQYAMDRWAYALADPVRFTLRIRAGGTP